MISLKIYFYTLFFDSLINKNNEFNKGNIAKATSDINISLIYFIKLSH